MWSSISSAIECEFWTREPKVEVKLKVTIILEVWLFLQVTALQDRLIAMRIYSSAGYIHYMLLECMLIWHIRADMTVSAFDSVNFKVNCISCLTHIKQDNFIQIWLQYPRKIPLHLLHYLDYILCMHLILVQHRMPWLMGYRLPRWSGLGGLGVLIWCRRLSSLDGGLGSRRGQLLGVSESSFGAEGLVRWIEALAHGYFFSSSGTESSLGDYNPVWQRTQVQGLPCHSARPEMIDCDNVGPRHIFAQNLGLLKHSTKVCSAPNWELLVELRFLCSTPLLSLSCRIHCSLRTLWELYTDFWVISTVVKFESQSGISFIPHIETIHVI